MFNKSTLVFSASLIAMTLASASAQVGDFNGDGLVECQDIDLLHNEIRTPTGDPRFDLTLDGLVNMSDRNRWLEAAGAVRGLGPIDAGDANFDGSIDHVDFNVFAVRFFDDGYGWCEADFDYNGSVNFALEREYFHSNWQKTSGINVPTNQYPAPVTTSRLIPTLDAWRNGEFMFAESEHFQFVAIPQRAPDGLLATLVEARTKDPAGKIATLSGVSITGDVHQTWSTFSSPYPNHPQQFFPLYPDHWVAADSHLFFTEDFATGLRTFFENNDKSNPVGLDGVLGTVLESFPAITGFGDLGMGRITDTGIFGPAKRTNSLKLAYLTTPAQLSDTATAGEVFLRIGVQGGDSNNHPIPYEGIFGMDDSMSIPFFAAPCDIDANGVCNVEDLNEILAASGTVNPTLDLDSGNPFIDQADRDAWLADAAIGSTRTLVVGDTDLDGDVDASDLNNLGKNWSRTGPLGWQAGDFDGNRKVDSGDLNAIGLNWQNGVAIASAVPEPNNTDWWIVPLIACLWRHPRNSRFLAWRQRRA